MCCLFGSRKTPACIVFILSFLAFAAGIGMIVFAARLNSSDFMDEIRSVEAVNDDMEGKSNTIFYALLIFAIITIIAAIMGCLACKIKHRCYTMLYGCVLLPTWIVILVVGILAFIAASVGKEVLLQQCSTGIRDLNTRISQDFNIQPSSSSSDPCDSGYNSNIAINLDVYEAIKINDEMCSKNCPCADIGTKAESWTSVDL